MPSAFLLKGTAMPKFTVTLYELHCTDYEIETTDVADALAGVLSGLGDTGDHLSTSYIEVAEKYAAEITPADEDGVTSDDIRQIKEKFAGVTYAETTRGVSIAGVRGVKLSDDQ